MRRQISPLVALALALVTFIAAGSHSANAAILADLAAVSKEVVGLPAVIPVNESIEFTVVEEVANFGPGGPVLTEVFEVLFPPEDCSVSFRVTDDLDVGLSSVQLLEVAVGGDVVAMDPASGTPFVAGLGVPLSIEFQVSLAAGQVFSVVEDWDLLCTQPSTHDFEFVKVVVPADDGVVDPFPDNNVLEEPFSVVAEEEEPGNVNDQLELGDLQFPPPGVTSPGGIFPITAAFQNIGQDALTNLFFIVTALEYTDGGTPAPDLDNRDAGTPPGVGAELTADLSSVSGTFDTGETIEVVFNVVLPIIAPFNFFVSAFSNVIPDPLTTVIGTVVDEASNPVEGATVDADGLTATALADGSFSIPNVPTIQGDIVVSAEATVGGTTLRGTSAALPPVPGGITDVGEIVVAAENCLAVGESTGGILTLPEEPGFSLTIEPGSATFPDGTRSGVLCVTVVDPDKIPMIPNFGQQPRFIATIEPPGVLFDPPAPITIPNLDGLAPGQVTEIYSFDHDLGQFVSIGTGTVSDDGTVIASDPGVGIIKSG